MLLRELSFINGHLIKALLDTFFVLAKEQA
jgi:hypothetical protein